MENLKKLHYIDVETGEYVSVSCKLKADAEIRAAILYNRIYQAKLDGQFNGYSLLADHYHTGSLIDHFKTILTQNVIDTTELLKCITCSEQSVSLPIANLTSSFFRLFDYLDETRMSADEYTLYMYYSSKQGTFGKNGMREAQLLSSAFNSNSRLFSYIGYQPSKIGVLDEDIAVKKIVPFVPKKSNSHNVKV